MLIKKISLAMTLLVSQLTLNVADSCSALVFNQHTSPLIALNLDWDVREGLVIIHPRHVNRVASVDPQQYQPLRWQSQYGSIIFHGSYEKPTRVAADGMNEKGLTAAILILTKSQYGSPNRQKPVLNTSSWVQYVLDNFQSVQDVIDHMPQIQLIADHYETDTMNLHFIVNDAMGNSAIFEYLDGQLHIYTSTQLQYQVLSNSGYESSVNNLANYKDFGGTLPLPGGYESPARFVRAAAFLKRLPTTLGNKERVAIAFNALGDVAEPLGLSAPTQFSMVFDSSTRIIYFRSIAEANLRFINMSAINWDDLTNSSSLPVHKHLTGDVLPYFQPFVDNVNKH